jgi:flagellar biosynthesis protein FlhB
MAAVLKFLYKTISNKNFKTTQKINLLKNIIIFSPAGGCLIFFIRSLGAFWKRAETYPTNFIFAFRQRLFALAGVALVVFLVLAA